MRNGADLDSLDGKQQQRFDCWHCGSELVWGGDNDLDDYTQDYDFVSIFQCMNCETFVEVYHKCQ